MERLITAIMKNIIKIKIFSNRTKCFKYFFFFRTSKIPTAVGLSLAVRTVFSSVANDSRCCDNFVVIMVITLGTSFTCGG